ncbi:hypothetical protein [Phycicoccus sp. Soil802]|uniref:hypothetical protein n=1 Tax=Phycicoccus sp. Soil802 TaxID=1736414 RepID=UPI00070282D4|nr:hypothetical protein [Phycicoccus sp. Soil802]KRF22213.1 hypothetical protein ASG91_17880 [Phycicoccus sp. Soil802]
MPTVSKSMKLAAAGGVAAVAAGIGASAAMADSTARPTPSGTSTSAPSQASPGRGGPGGGGHHGGPGGLDAAALATKLGLTEAKVTAALEKLRAAQQPSSPPAQGSQATDAERQAREKARVTALAKELGVSQVKVQAALDAIKADREASRRTELTTRLDAAVKAGTLSAADRAAVLKAVDAGVLGGGRP